MDFLLIGPTTLWEITSRGELPHVRFCRRVMYRREDLEAYVMRHRVPARQ